MKVGILTYHFGANYGAILQAFALQETVSGLGHQVHVIDYRPNSRILPKFWKGWLDSSLSTERVHNRYIQLRYGKALLRKFDHFRNYYLHLTNRADSLNAVCEIAPEFDAIICGSDQIWNFRCSPAYFLNLGDRYTGRKISYAACCTQLEQPEHRIQEVGKWIRDFHAISVRDPFSKSAVESASGRTAALVCDPTQLMADPWPIECEARKKDEILIYRLSSPINGGFRPLIHRIRETLGNIPVTGIVTATSNPVVSVDVDRVEYLFSPIEWAESIRNCAIFITDSYHGILFALKYNVPFLAYSTNLERAPRLLDLAKRLKLRDQIVSNSDQAIRTLDKIFSSKSNSSTDYQKSIIADSKAFLKSSLE